MYAYIKTRIQMNCHYLRSFFRVVLYTALFLLMLVFIPAFADNSDYQANDYLEKANGYTLSGSVNLTLQGQRGLHQLDLSLFVSQSGEYWYALADQKRNISVLQSDGSIGKSIAWKIDEDCPSPTGVDALCCLERTYDYYHDRLGWQMKDGAAIVAFLNSGAKDNASMGYEEELNIISGKIGSARENSFMFSAVPQIMAHEFTHGVLMHEGVLRDEMEYPSISNLIPSIPDAMNEVIGTEAQAVHEGYADVMGLCIFPENDWVYARGTTSQRDLSHPELKHYDDYDAWLNNIVKVITQLNDTTEEHSAGQLIGYAACLMNKTYPPNVMPNNNKSSRGDPLDNGLLAQLFYRSVKYLPTYPSFIDAGLALICSSQELCNMTDPNTGKLYMTREQAIRVRWALDKTGIYRRIGFNPNHFEVSLLSFDKTPFSDYIVEIRKEQTGDAIWSKDAEGMTTEIQVPDSIFTGWLIIKSKADPQREMRYAIIRDTSYLIFDDPTGYLFYTPFEPLSNKKPLTDDLKAPDEESLLIGYLQDDLISQFAVMPTDTIYNSEARTNAELSGMLSAHIEDFDDDGQIELLINAFHMEPKKDAHGTDQLVWTMQLFEVKDGKVTLQAERNLRLPDFAGPMGMYGTTANAFTYKNKGKICIALDTYYGINERTTTVNAYHYDGNDFIYVGGAGFQNYGQGDMLIRQADEESAWDNVANCSDWMALLSDSFSAWQTTHKWDTEAHDWNLPSEEEKESYLSLYREELSRLGLNVQNDPRIPHKETEDQESESNWEEQYNICFLQTPESVYNDSSTVRSMWRISTYQLLGGPLELHREDPTGSLDAYRS